MSIVAVQILQKRVFELRKVHKDGHQLRADAAYIPMATV